MSEKIALKKLPTAAISLLGSGVMQWSKDKQIDVMQGMLRSPVYYLASHYIDAERRSLFFSFLVFSCKVCS